MLRDDQVWTPGSFTKNFSWGRGIGLQRLHESIRIGFDNSLEDVPRSLYIERVREHERLKNAKERPFQIPANFFLFNQIRSGVDYLVVDELVFKAITAKHSANFDALGIFSLNFSRAGQWIGARGDQRYPALWANHYIRNRVARDFGWDTKKISATDIEHFVFDDKRFAADSAEKLSTNLFYIYKEGGLARYFSKKVERWWVDALFLAMDRLIRDEEIDGGQIGPDQFLKSLVKADFFALTGPESLEKGLALKHLVQLYDQCGAERRFSVEHVEELNKVRLNHISNYIEPVSVLSNAVHPTNPRLLKVIPRVCAMLARYAGFLTFDEDDLSVLDVQELIRTRTREGLERIRSKRVITNMSADELMRLTRN